MKTNYKLLNILVATVVSGLLFALPAQAVVSKASGWIGETVVTPDGQTLGRVEDFALDLDSKSVQYVVVAIGGFLIDDGLIAVPPEALRASADSSELVVHASNLATAKRFSNDSWPEQADVVAVAPADKSDAANTAASGTDAELDKSVEAFTSGTATISNSRRKAVFEDGERRIENLGGARRANNNRGSGDLTKDPLPSFASVDADKNGKLTRWEIGSRMSRNETFSDLDLDSDGALDKFEYEVLAAARKP